MFSEAYKNLCIENAEKLREECQLTVGDWVYLQSLGLVALVVGVDVGPDPETFALSLSHDELSLSHDEIGHFENEGRTLIPLPTLRQLIRMLEERGWYWQLVKLGHEDYAATYMTSEFYRKETCLGPDPETALLKALMEVMKDG